ncbi:hypothetical protein Tco_0534572 [Tanacetum coccineum]
MCCFKPNAPYDVLNPDPNTSLGLFLKPNAPFGAVTAKRNLLGRCTAVAATMPWQWRWWPTVGGGVAAVEVVRLRGDSDGVELWRLGEGDDGEVVVMVVTRW